MMKLSALALAFFSVPALAYDGIKPVANDPDAQRKCQQLSTTASQHGVRTLVIGFEGLASFSASSTRAAYEYQHALMNGRNPRPPTGGMGGFVARGLMIPAVQKLKGSFEFLVFPFTNTSTAETCALEWMRVPGRKLVITGHSYGGDAAVQLAEALESRSIPLELGLTIDARAVFPRSGRVIHKTRNAKRWENYYEIGALPGRPIPDANINQRLRAGHTAMPFQPEVRGALIRALLK